MAHSGRMLLFIALMLVIQLTEPKDGHSGAARSSSIRSRRSSSRRAYRTYTTGSGYGTTGTYGRGLTWWQICLIIGGILLVFLVLYCCVRACRRQEPESDTPGIQSTRDQIRLRDHQTINHFPEPDYQPLPCSDGREIAPPPPTIMYGQQQQQLPPGTMATAPPGAMATAPPPSYDDALDTTKEPIGEGAVDRWEDEPKINRKDFGVI